MDTNNLHTKNLSCGAGSILVPGRNCWKTGHAPRASVLVDGESYFRAFARAMEQAREQVIILGWDIDSRVLLLRDGTPAKTSRLASLLNRMASSRPDLHIYILVWDFVVLYALDREPLPVLKLDWRTHKRVRFKLDGTHPVGASHHQKVVVIDDSIAFSGGIDLTARRWDTPEHRPLDPRRTDPGSNRYRPFHDVQMAVEGEAAAALGEMARERWRRATGEKLDPPRSRHTIWPHELEPDFTAVEAAVARTDPDNPQGAVREIERLYLDSIKAAKRHIYIENQYLTSHAVRDALAERLQQEDGPEVVIVAPLSGSGWLDGTLMGVMRARWLRKLSRADRFGRLGVYYPAADDGAPIYVHSKVMIADDRLVRVGSSNLSNRSMGLDTECDLAIDARREDRIKNNIRSVRLRLLSEHLDESPERVDETEQMRGSMLEAVEELRGGGRTLRPLEDHTPEWVEELVPESTFYDPEKPTDIEELAYFFIGPELSKPGRRYHWPAAAALLALLAALAAMWRYTPLSEYADPAALLVLVEPFVEEPWAPAIVVGGFIAGGLLAFPVTVMILATAMVFDPFDAFVYALTGSLISATLLYWAGRGLGDDFVRKVAGERANRISQRLAKRGIVTIMVLRVAPVAPFTVINLVAGVSHIKFRDYLIGTVAGMTPGIIVLTMFGESLAKTIKSPEPENFITLAAVAAFITAAAWFLNRAAAKKSGRDEH